MNNPYNTARAQKIMDRIFQKAGIGRIEVKAANVINLPAMEESLVDARLKEATLTLDEIKRIEKEAEREHLVLFSVRGIGSDLRLSFYWKW
ncbi:MAG: hypothetical protein JRD89_00930 [Deltaproteobacteria bacterium]|nr:hypothetical protein [Deltaproteobacteria bacterium]